ncbi:hypothetical protein [Pseudosulfitobacter sp. DSM 107133]|jgi:hypothetical protein|uniref:hypothetical protein n=1 Tax=Pseudosulfitobacter sp. DSM 107133 TaxID=2883100 RepID=UPI0013B426BC|nr:hypothetical protein [Pseudosulfitobacter sp. DSM 107133]UOA28217.1 hypothetical protein DSM107133_02962 [Pseudosulfitobacter sp. DSM 107133]
MSGLAEDAVVEAKQVISDLAGYLRAVGHDLTDDSAAQVDTLAQRLEIIARDCEQYRRRSTPKLYCVKG